MAKVKRYESKRWLQRKFYNEKLSVEEIAEECGVSHMTIRRALDKFGIK